MLPAIVHISPGSMHEVSPWYVNTSAALDSFQTIDVSVTATYPCPPAPLGNFSSKKDHDLLVPSIPRKAVPEGHPRAESGMGVPSIADVE